MMAEGDRINEIVSSLSTPPDFFRFLSVAIHVSFAGNHYDEITPAAATFIDVAVKVWNTSHPDMPLMYEEAISELKHAWQKDMQHIQRIATFEK